MSQLVAPYPGSFFGESKDFSHQSQYMTDKHTFVAGQPDFEQKKSETQDATAEAQAQAGYNPFYQYTTPMYNMYNSYVTFSTTFPRAKDYYSQESILEAFPQLEGINNHEFDLSAIPDHARFYILRSSNDDNIHKAIKYHMWSTTTNGKAILSNAWKDDEKRGLTPEVYLIFSVVNSNHVLGVAKMTSDIKDDETFMYWWEPAKWFGSFQLKWIFIKDIHCSKFEHIKEDSSASSSLINLKDSTSLTLESGKEVLKVFRDFIAKTNIFGSFAYMDQREDYIRLQRENNTQFLDYFNECCSAYKQDPEGFSPLRKTHSSYRKGGRYNNSNNYYGNRRQGGFTYKKTYVQAKKPYINTKEKGQSSTNVPKEQPLNYSDEEFPQLSLAEEYGVKSAGKKTKGLKISQKTTSLGN